MYTHYELLIVPSLTTMRLSVAQLVRISTLRDLRPIVFSDLHSQRSVANSLSRSDGSLAGICLKIRIASSVCLIHTVMYTCVYSGLRTRIDEFVTSAHLTSVYASSVSSVTGASPRSSHGPPPDVEDHMCTSTFI